MTLARMDQLAALARAPIAFERNETWRVYAGGKLLRELRGQPDPQDNHFPEDWIASMTRADNPPRDGRPALEGISVIRGTDVPFSLLVELFPREIVGEAHAAAFGPRTQVLAKFLDSAVRLPIQAHPDDDYARRYFNASVGKTEAWIVVATRVVDGVEPYILLDLHPDVDAAGFRRLVEEQDLEGQVACLNRIPVLPGEAYLVAARTLHAIGSGVFMIEVQQPSDLVVHTERRVVDIEISEQAAHMGLGWDTALDILDYTGRTVQETTAHAKLQPQEVLRLSGGTVQQVISYRDTPFFASRRIQVQGELKLTNQHFYAGAVVSGAGSLACSRAEMQLRPGDTFLVPNSVRAHTYRATDCGLQIITADPPAIACPR